jgi:hypothetical protein
MSSPTHLLNAMLNWSRRRENSRHWILVPSQPVVPMDDVLSWGTFGMDDHPLQPVGGVS